MYGRFCQEAKKVQTDKPQRTAKKVAVITRWPCYRGGRKAGFLGIFNNPIFYLVLIGLTRCSGQEGELTRFLLNTTHYSNKFRPVKDDNTTVNVEHSLILQRIVKVVSCNCFEIQFVLCFGKLNDFFKSHPKSLKQLPWPTGHQKSFLREQHQEVLPSNPAYITPGNWGWELVSICA